MTAHGVGRNPLVSVVIPTVGRAELPRAVASARGQADVDIEVVVAVDAAEGSIDLPAEVTETADRVVWTGGRRGGSHARNLGVRASSGAWVAFLDDDDEWLPEKTRRQLALADHGRAHLPVLSSRHVHVDVRTGHVSKPVARATIGDGQPVEEYLFRRRRPAGGRASMYTSTLLCPRAVADSVPWDETLSRHQDWDWLVRAARVPGVTLLQAPDALVRIQTGSVGSISARSDWEPSLRWADSALRSSPATYADFVTGQTLRYAVAARSWRGVRECVAALVRCRRVPSLGPVLIALGGLLPRRTIEILTSRIR